MNFKLLLAGLIVLLAVGTVFFVRITHDRFQSDEDYAQAFLEGQQNQQRSLLSNQTVTVTNATTGTTNIAVNTTASTPSSTTNTITTATLALHHSLNDCWVSYKGKVYDITSFLPRHPGSAGAILPYCGSSDAFEKAFTKQHGSSKANMLVWVSTFIGDFDVVGNA